MENLNFKCNLWFKGENVFKKIEGTKIEKNIFIFKNYFVKEENKNLENYFAEFFIEIPTYYILKYIIPKAKNQVNK